MKTIISTITALCLLLTSAFAAETVFISQVYYDPVFSEAGSEAVELYNPTNQSIDISGYKIATKGNPADATLPNGSIIKPKEYFLIGDADWRVLRDSYSWAFADYEEAMTLVNTDAGVALISSTGIVDAVGWGDVLDISLFEGTPAKEVPAGFALRRENLTDTNNNSVDFVKSIPVFHNKTKEPAAGDTLSLTVNVTNEKPIIQKISVHDDDIAKEGVQVLPLPGENKTVQVTVAAQDANGFEDITQATLVFNEQEKNLSFVHNTSAVEAEYTTNISLPYYFIAKEYRMNISVTDGDIITEENSSFTYLNITAFALDTDTLSLNATPGTNITIQGDIDFFSTTQPTVKNLGNTPLDIGVFAQTFSNGKNTIPLTNIQYSFDNFKQTNVMSDQLTLHPTQVQPGIAAFQLLGLRLLLPATLSAGLYSGTITVVGASA